MGSQKIERGPIAAQVSRNVAELRHKRGMSLAQLSEVMSDMAGRPILPSGLGKIESGERRVDVDDLVALAMALGVSPVRLLLPVEQPDEDVVEEPVDFLHGRSPGSVELTAGLSVPWKLAWQWACGEEPFAGLDRYGDWQVENRPHARQGPSKAELLRLADKVRDIGRDMERAARELRQAAGEDAEPAPNALTVYLTEQAEAEERRRRG